MPHIQNKKLWRADSGSGASWNESCWLKNFFSSKTTQYPINWVFFIPFVLFICCCCFCCCLWLNCRINFLLEHDKYGYDFRNTHTSVRVLEEEETKWIGKTNLSSMNVGMKVMSSQSWNEWTMSRSISNFWFFVVLFYFWIGRMPKVI